MRAGGGAEAGDRAPAAARGWELTGDGDRGVAGLYLGRGLAQEHRHGMRSPPGHSGEGIRARYGVLDGEGGSGRRTSPAGARSRGSGGLLGTS